MFIRVSQLYKKEHNEGPRLHINFQNQAMITGTLESLTKKMPGIYEVKLSGVPFVFELSGKDMLTARWPKKPWIEEGMTEEEYRNMEAQRIADPPQPPVINY